MVKTVRPAVGRYRVQHVRAGEALQQHAGPGARRVPAVTPSVRAVQRAYQDLGVRDRVEQRDP